MPELERSIAEWRKTMQSASALAQPTIDELETHLRETVEELVRSGMTEPVAFQRAVERLGSPEAVVSEFQKLQQFTWRPAMAVTGMGVVAALLLAAYLGSLVHRPGVNQAQGEVLFQIEIFVLALSNVTVLLHGVLGICFVCQRSLSDFSPGRSRSLSRLSFVYGSTAAGFIATGTILGMVRSHWYLGYWWRWDLGSVGQLALLVWLVSFLVTHRQQQMAGRCLLGVSLLGSSIVILKACIPFWVSVESYRYGVPAWLQWAFVVALISHLMFYFVGLAPAGWLRLRKA